MTRAVDLLKTNFGVSQLYTHDVVKDGKTLFTVYWHPLTLAERETIVKQSGGNLIDNFNDYSLQLMITKALDKDGILFKNKNSIKILTERITHKV